MGSVDGLTGIISIELIRMVAGDETVEDVVTINDDTHRLFNTIADLLSFLNGEFKTTYDLQGSFNLAAGNYINYVNRERFVSGQIGFEGDIITGYYDMRYYSSQYYRAG